MICLENLSWRFLDWWNGRMRGFLTKRSRCGTRPVDRINLSEVGKCVKVGRVVDRIAHWLSLFNMSINLSLIYLYLLLPVIALITVLAVLNSRLSLARLAFCRLFL